MPDLDCSMRWVESENEDSEIEDSENEDSENEDSEIEDSENEDSENEDSEIEDSENEDSEQEDSEIEDSEIEDSENESVAVDLEKLLAKIEKLTPAAQTRICERMADFLAQQDTSLPGFSELTDHNDPAVDGKALEIILGQSIEKHGVANFLYWVMTKEAKEEKMEYTALKTNDEAFEASCGYTETSKIYLPPGGKGCIGPDLFGFFCLKSETGHGLIMFALKASSKAHFQEKPTDSTKKRQGFVTKDSIGNAIRTTDQVNLFKGKALGTGKANVRNSYWFNNVYPHLRFIIRVHLILPPFNGLYADEWTPGISKLTDGNVETYVVNIDQSNLLHCQLFAENDVQKLIDYFVDKM